MTILDEIIAYKKQEVKDLQFRTTFAQLESSEYFNRVCPDIKAEFLRTDKVGIIAEHKRQSPSKGIINSTNTVEEIVKGYQTAGATAVSVLTDNKYFGGSNKDLLKARKVIDIPILRKDFTVSEFQVLEAKALGADMILLIAHAIETKLLKQLAKTAKNIGLNILLEVHTLEELDDTLNDFVDLVGVNNRNLKTFEVDIQNSINIAKHIPSEFIKIAESGISNTTTIKEQQQHGFNGFLIGENFMKTKNPAQACIDFIKELK
jgi:indole-3-glycerol phosphate synthase